MTEPTEPGYVADLIARLELEPLEHEGGLYRQMFNDGQSTAIYYLLQAPDFSALHLLTTPEVYHWYQGTPLQLVIIEPDGKVLKPVLGPDIAAGQVHQYVVPGGVWHGSYPLGEWALIGTTMAPPFSWDGFELGGRAALIDRFPHASAEINALTRTGLGAASGQSVD